MRHLAALALLAASVYHHGSLPADFGTRPSSGDPVTDCGSWAEATDLTDLELAILERCLDIHGWTYDHEPTGEE